MITDIAHGEADLDTLKAGASLIPVAKITKVPKVVKAIGNVGKTGSKKGKEGEKIAKSGQAKQTKAKNKGKSGAETGEYDTVKGHHVHAKAGFRGTLIMILIKDLLLVKILWKEMDLTIKR